jgi:hypothetical protein
MGISDPSDLAFALYVRAAAEIVCAGDVPPLIAPVPVWSHALTQVRREALATQWSSWWSALLSRRTDGSVASGYDGPDFASMARFPELRRVQREVFLPAQTWRAASGLEPWSYPNHDGFSLIRHVTELEETLGRPARPFSFSVEVIPTVGAWLSDLSPTQMIVSEALCADGAALREVLRPRLALLA